MKTATRDQMTLWDTAIPSSLMGQAEERMSVSKPNVAVAPPSAHQKTRERKGGKVIDLDPKQREYDCQVWPCQSVATVLLEEIEGSNIWLPLCSKHAKAWEKQR